MDIKSSTALATCLNVPIFSELLRRLVGRPTLTE